MSSCCTRGCIHIGDPGMPETLRPCFAPGRRFICKKDLRSPERRRRSSAIWKRSLPCYHLGIQSMPLSTKRSSAASFSYMDHPFKLFAVSLDYLPSILQVVLVFVYGQLFIIWTIIKNNRLIYSLSRGLTPSSSLFFLPKFPLLFLALCRKRRAFKSSRLRSVAQQ